MKHKTYKEYKQYAIDKAITKDKVFLFETDNRLHYVYRVTEISTGIHYYGSRVSSTLDIGIDYFTSSTVKKFKDAFNQNPQNFKIKIIKIFDNKDDRYLYESFLHQYFNVSKSKNFYNKANQTAFGFKPDGPQSEEHRQKLSEAKQRVTKEENEETKRKRNETINKVQENGLTIKEMAMLKYIETMKNDIDENGLNAFERIGKINKEILLSKTEEEMIAIKEKEKFTKLNNIDENGLNSYERMALKRKETYKNKSSKELQEIYNKRVETMKNDIDENGLNKFQQIAKKTAETYNKLSDELKKEKYDKLKQIRIEKYGAYYSEESKKKISETHKNKTQEEKDISFTQGFYTNVKLGHANIYKFYDKDDILRFESNCGIEKFLKKMDLPRAFMKSSDKLSWNDNGKRQLNANKNLNHLVYEGWYAIKVN